MNVDKTVEEKTVSYIGRLGVERDQARIYLFLLQNGAATVLTISRGLDTGRTKLYPLLEQLSLKQLITVHARHYGTSYEAQSPDVLEFLVSERERESEALRHELGSISHSLQALRSLSPSTSRIVEYRGVDGLKQVNWNLTKAKTEFRVLELQHLSQHLGMHFAEKVRSRQVEKKITSFDLSNDPDWHIDSNVRGFEKYSKGCYIPKEIFTIEFETYIYDNCVGLLSYDEQEILGVEIYNEKLAAQQRRLFDLLWKLADSKKRDPKEATDLPENTYNR